MPAKSKTKINKDNNFQFYKLWWEYLKRNDDYKELCEWVFNNKETRYLISSSACPKFQKIKKLEDVDFDSVIDPDLQDSICIDPNNPNNSSTGLTLYKNNVIANLGRCWLVNSGLYANLFRFGNVHANSFETWMNMQQEDIKINSQKSVTIYNFEQEFNSSIEHFKRAEERNPTIQEFVDHFLSRIYFPCSATIHFEVDLLTPYTIQDLLKQIGKIIKKERNKPEIRRIRAEKNLLPFSNTQVKDNYLRLDELERYLKIYDLKKQGLKMMDIIKIIEPKAYNKDVNVQRAFYLDIEKAKMIIKNVGLGIFPGEYQPRKDKTKRLKTKD